MRRVGEAKQERVRGVDGVDRVGGVDGVGGVAKRSPAKREI